MKEYMTDLQNELKDRIRCSKITFYICLVVTIITCGMAIRNIFNDSWLGFGICSVCGVIMGIYTYIARKDIEDAMIMYVLFKGLSDKYIKEQTHVK